MRHLWLIHGYMWARASKGRILNVYAGLVESCKLFQRVYYESLKRDGSIALAWGDVKSATQVFVAAYRMTCNGEHESGKRLQVCCVEVVVNHLCRDAASLIVLPNWRGAVHADISYLTGCLVACYERAHDYTWLYDRCREFADLYKGHQTMMRHHEWHNTFIACQRFITTYENTL